MPNTASVEWKCSCIPGYVEKGNTCTNLPEGIFSQHELFPTVPTTAPIGHTVLTIAFSQILDICTKNPDVTLLGDADLFEAVVTNACKTLTIRTTATLPLEYSVRKLMLKAKFEAGDNVIVDAIFVTVTIQSTGNIVVVLPDMTFSDHLVTSLAPSDTLSLSNSAYMKVTSDGRVYTTQQLNIDDISSGDAEVAIPLTTGIIVGSSTTSTNLTAVVLKTKVKRSIPEDTTNNFIVASFKQLRQSSLTISVTSDVNNNIFAFDGTELKVVNSQELDYDKGQTRFTFTISVAITMDTKVVTLPVTVDIEVLPTNDNSPVFITDTGVVTNKYTFTVFPTPLSGTLCGAVRARDADSGSQLSFTLDQQSDLVNYFTVGQHDGIVTTLNSTENIPFINNTGVSGDRYVTFAVQVRDEINIHTVTSSVTVYLKSAPARNLEFTFSASVHEDLPLQAFVTSVNQTGYTKYEFASRTGTTAFFTIDTITGQVLVKKSLDREIQDSYKFSVTAIEERSQTCTLVVLGDLTITILDVNDNSPVFGRTSYNGEVYEGMARNSIVKLDFLITATDDDTGSLSFGISQGSSSFAISPSGEISTKEIFDRETVSVYSVGVTVNDGIHTTETIVSVSIVDQNDNDPSFRAASYSTTILEGALVGSSLIAVDADDADADNNADLSYFLGGGGDTFVIDYKTGLISVSGLLDREQQASYSLVVTVRDGGDTPKSALVTVTVDVGDVNDNDPEFVADSLLISTNEEVNCASNPIIGRLRATDRDDSDVLQYSIYNTSDTRFSVDTNTGDISCVQRLDYETEQKLELVVTATDKGTNPRTTIATVIVSLLDINDNSPVVTHLNTTTLQINEFSETRQIMVVAVEDEDSGQNGQVMFSLSMSAPDLLTIDDKGIISTAVVGALPVAGSYLATVIVADKGVPSRSSSSTVTIKVTSNTNVNLKFNTQHHMFTVLENENSNTDVGNVGQNLNNPQNLVPLYELPKPSDTFMIDRDRGVIRTKVLLDREKTAEHIFFVRVHTSSATEGDLTLVNVTVGDTNDHSPKFSLDKYRGISVPEDTGVGSLIITIDVTDDDVGVNAETYFSLQNRSNSVCVLDFNIGERNGELKVVKELDYETYIQCLFTVVVYDKSSTPRTSSISVDVIITDVNDNSPTFNASTYTVQVPESFRSETNVFGRVSDADSNENGQIELSDTSTSVCPFKIKTGTTSLVLQFNGSEPLDYETKTSYVCSIMAVDMATANSRRRSSVNVTVSIMDVNDNAPIFTSPSYHVNISRDVRVETDVIRVSATDADSGRNKQIKYSLTGNDDYLNIDLNTGQVTVGKSLYDYGRDTMLTTVTATDTGSDALSSSVTLTIDIEDANVRPNFPEPTTVYKDLREETQFTGILYTVTANDWDGTTIRKCACTYRLQHTSSVFEVDSETGEVRMKAGTSLDRERDGSNVNIGIIARDKESPPKDSEPLVLNINVLDINDQSPRFRYRNIPTFKIYQGHQSGSEIGNVTAEDMDGSAFNITWYSVTDLFYSTSATFSDRDTSVFGFSTINVDRISGTLRTTRSLSLVGQTTTFYIMLTVEAVDAGDSSMKDSTHIIVEVKYEDPNQHYPRFTQDRYQKEIPRSYSLTEVVLGVSASDADKGIYKVIKYSIISGNYRDVMSIDPSSGEIKLAYLIDEKFDASNVTMTVRATDSGDIPKYSSSIVSIKLSGEYQSCFTSAMRTEIVAEKDMFFGVMIGLVVALCIAIGLNFVFFYKYRIVDKELDTYVPSRNKSKEMTYDDLQQKNGRQDEHAYTTATTAAKDNNEGYEVLPGPAGVTHPYMSVKEVQGIDSQAYQHSNPAFSRSEDGIEVLLQDQRA